MADRRPPPAPEALLQHQEFLRALARGLLGDAERAEDAVQDAYAAALAHPPSEAGALRGWLATVVRNGALNQLRAESRRLARERDAARAEVLADDVGERLRTQQRVLAAVESLREPFRTAVYLRYAEGLPPRAIAERTAAPVETVRSRIQRGLEMLRRDLDREYGDRSAWSVALLPFATSLRSTRAPLLVAAAVIVFVFVPAAVWLSSEPHGERLEGVAPLASLSTRTVATLPADDVAPRSVGVVSVPGTIAPASPNPAAAAPSSTWIQYLDASGLPLRGVYTGSVSASDARGWLELRAGFDPVWVEPRDAASEERFGRLELARNPDGSWMARLDVALELTLVGDPTRIAGALVRLRLPGERDAFVSRAHPDGLVRFGRVPRASLLAQGTSSTWHLSVVTFDGMSRADALIHALPGRHPESVVLAFQPAGRLAVGVVDAAGATARGSTLQADHDVPAARDGVFTLDGITADHVKIVAWAPGHLTRTQTVAVGPGQMIWHQLVLTPRAGFDLEVELVSTSGRDMPGSVHVRTDAARWEETPIVASGKGRGRAELHDLPAGEIEILPPFDEPWLWNPPRARVSVPGGTVRFVRDDAQEPRPILVEARDESGRVLPSVRVGHMVDRGEHGARETWRAQRHVPLVELSSGAELRPGVLPGQRAWWVVEADGCQSTWGDERAFRVRDGRFVLDVVLRPAWHCELAFVHLDDAGVSRPLEGVRLRTSAGLELARSLPDGRIVLDALFDPGQMQVDRPGWSVAAWEGFVRGKRRVELPVHRVLMEPD